MSREMRLHTEDNHDRMAREVRVDMVRLSVALAVAIKLHTRIALSGYCFGEVSKDAKWRIDWDRLRIKQLLYDEEFDMVDKTIGLYESTVGRQTLKTLVNQFKGKIARNGPQEPP